jgi:hypothetical protein
MPLVVEATIIFLFEYFKRCGGLQVDESIIYVAFSPLDWVKTQSPWQGSSQAVFLFSATPLSIFLSPIHGCVSQFTPKIFVVGQNCRHSFSNLSANFCSRNITLAMASRIVLKATINLYNPHFCFFTHPFAWHVHCGGRFHAWVFG